MREEIGERLPPGEDRPELVHAVPETHYPEQLNAASELVDRHVTDGHGDDVAIYFEDERITYAALQERIDRFGDALADAGVEPGSRVLVRFPNRPESIVACLAVQKVGGVALPSMKLLRAKELRYIVDDAGATHAVVYDELLDELEAAMPDLDALEEVVVCERTGVDHDHRSYDTMLEHGDPGLTAHGTGRNDLALMLYTSGTTGQPKGAVHTHRQLLASADSYARYCLAPTREDVFGGNPPLPFAYGFGCLVTFPFRFGAATSLVQDATPETMLEAVENHGMSVLCSIPTAFNQMLAEFDGPAEYDVSSLRVGTSAGEPLAPSTFTEFEAEYGIELLDGIGTTEMLHIFISHRHDDEVDPTATGYPVPGYECRVVDPDTGEELDRGEAGLLEVRGPTGITYWGRPDKQAEAVRDGWSAPGDIFVHREDGRFEYKSRQDDLIVTSGYNVPGPEVENALQERESVAEVAVVGSPDEERGKIVKAFVVASSATEPDDHLVASLQNHVKSTLAPYKYPREVEFVDELPRTETGKIQRVKLRERERERFEGSR
ncbi:MAG: acyl-CoA synthetase [Salinirussus sp.]